MRGLSIASSSGKSAEQKAPVNAGAIHKRFAMAKAHPGMCLNNLGSPAPRASGEAFLDICSNPGLSWAHIETLRGRTRLPIMLKGMLHPDDAKRAFEIGVDAIVVSNHGGRQIDNSIASLDALIEVRISHRRSAWR